MANDEDYKQLIKTLEDMILQCDNIGSTVSNGSSNSLSILTSCFNAIVADIRRVDAISCKFEDVKVPLDVIELIDRGKNPELYLGNFIKDAFKSMELFRSKLVVYSYFLESLKNELKKTCPEVFAIYQLIKQPVEDNKNDCYTNGTDSPDAPSSYIS
ncbi:Mediator of RNA polymerase II transcription subunit 10 [Thelohanellus kitauei]|uniref:Mediator of RNA polymerase II transcription subunit 10 n=1 Tax=Thelohanellus kitauei TaxID=669202 RepID=A0A0C2MVW8_THEKT|nr:Mediator of RNA polymerase II transcription subunit 10 [Thelohanellus kitauei]